MAEAASVTTSTLARDIMTTDVRAANANWPITYLAEFLIEHGISGVPVVDDADSLVGVASLTDIVRHDSLPAREPGRAVTNTYYHEDLKSGFSDEEISSFRLEARGDVVVRDIMTPMIFSVQEDATVAAIAKTMVTGRIHRVLVTRGDRLVGIIAALDILRLLS